MIIRYETSDGKKFDNEAAAKAHEATIVTTLRDKTTFKFGDMMNVLTDANMRKGLEAAVDFYLANRPKPPAKPRKPRKTAEEKAAEKAAKEAAAAAAPVVNPLA
jgi:hypothetical protein